MSWEIRRDLLCCVRSGRLFRATCALLGHLPGGPVIFSYQRMDKSISQWPNRRGPTVIKILGTECPRCGAVQKPEKSAFEAAREMVDDLREEETN